MFGIRLRAMPWLLALPFAALAQTPTFHPLAGSKKADATGSDRNMRKAQTLPAPLLSETRAIPRADGGLDIRCDVIAAPRQREGQNPDLSGPQP